MISSSRSVSSVLLKSLSQRLRPDQSRLSMQRSYSTEPSVNVSPLQCMFDEPVSITAKGLTPGQGYTLGCSISDSKGVPFNALVHYTADENGSIDTAVQPAIGGHFRGVQPMGLVSHIRTAASSGMLHYRFSYKDVTKPPTYDISLYEGYYAAHIAVTGMMADPVSTVSHVRNLVGPGVRRISVNHGRVRGVLYLPAGPGPFPAVVDMFGSAGGCMQHRSALLAYRGVAALSLAFFDYEDLPKTLKELDMSYFEEAVHYLCGLDEVDASRGVGAMGVSKGGDLVLNMMLNIPEVTAIVPINGCISNVETKFRLQNGKICPPLGFSMESLLLLPNNCFDVYEFLKDPKDFPKTILPIEDIKGSVLWIVGEGDRNWKSGYFADMALESVKGTPAEDKLEVVRYPGAGHLIEPAYVPFCEMSYHKVVKQAMLWGGEAELHSKAQVESWARILSFFKEKLGPQVSAKL